MNFFELERLRREGKNVNLSGGRSALDVVTEMEFSEADKRIDRFFTRKAEVKTSAITAGDWEDESIGDIEERFLGC